MTSKEHQYFSINRILLLIVGSWPYQQSIFAKFQYIVICVILLSNIIFQLTSFLTLHCTVEVIVRILAIVTFFSVAIIQYIIFHFNIEGVKDLLMQLQHIHNELKNKNEIAIIKKYDCIAKRYVIGLIAVGICGIFLTVITELILSIIDIQSSTNASRSHFFLLKMEYFIDQEKYFYFIWVHINATISIITITLVANGTMLIAYIQHVCGVFRIASYRMKYGININVLQNVMLKNKVWMIKHISYAVDIHRQAMKLMKQLMIILNKMMFCLIVFGVATLSLNLYLLVLAKNNIHIFLLTCVIVFVCILYMFLANNMGQIIIDHNNHVFISAYNAQWYKTPIQVQKMILFILQRRSKAFTLNVGRLFDASMEGFATVKLQKDMISKENQYFSLNRILLLIIGSWPYQQSNFAKFQYIIICAIMISGIIFQVKDLLIQLQHIYNELKNENEIVIIKKYDNIANRYVTVLAAIGICGIFSSIISQFLMNVVNVDSSTNASRYFFLLSMEYFIDQEKHFYLILLHINIIVIISTTAMVANGTMLIAYIQHICGIFRIASYRIKYAININILHNVTPKNKIWMIKHISYAVDIHRQAMKLMKQLMTILNKMMFCLIVVGVASLSLNLYHMVLLKTSFETLLSPSVHTFVCILYMFLANHMGQIIIDHNNHVFITAYNVEWYKTPVAVQKMILFVLQRRSKPFTLNVGGLFDASMEGFATSYIQYSDKMNLNLLPSVKEQLRRFILIQKSIFLWKLRVVRYYVVKKECTRLNYLNYLKC
ncbi:uncharacterized protein LOC105202591 [Solenopsis invicta]|uniref:uncharacterized protein LOC105202591 n=1 Tax=Solenopsis invicta TaxID=13686 RepID=UPI00193CFEE2|nr:uncharacterized protein LOC105202591 [Solenopsis invicta]